ncbi:hypothetical protein [Microseira wollei]|nr:hypothetical protein [Microseira wollei]
MLDWKQVKKLSAPLISKSTIRTCGGVGEKKMASALIANKALPRHTAGEF